MTRNQKIAGGVTAGVLAITGAIAGGQLATQTTAGEETTPIPGIIPEPYPKLCGQAPPEEQCIVPAPTTGFTVKVPLKSCGIKQTYNVKDQDVILVENVGTVPRWVLPSSVGPPMPTGSLPPGDWFDFYFSQPGTFVVTIQHQPCIDVGKAYAQKITFVVT